MGIQLAAKKTKESLNWFSGVLDTSDEIEEGAHGLAHAEVHAPRLLVGGQRVVARQEARHGRRRAAVRAEALARARVAQALHLAARHHVLAAACAPREAAPTGDAAADAVDDRAAARRLLADGDALARRDDPLPRLVERRHQEAGEGRADRRRDALGRAAEHLLDGKDAVAKSRRTASSSRVRRQADCAASRTTPSGSKETARTSSNSPSSASPRRTSRPRSRGPARRSP